MEVAVGKPVQYVPDDDHEDSPLAAVVVKICHAGHADLVYWCPESKRHKEALNVRPFRTSNGDVNEPYFLEVGTI